MENTMETTRPYAVLLEGTEIVEIFKTKRDLAEYSAAYDSQHAKLEYEPNGDFPGMYDAYITITNHFGSKNRVRVTYGEPQDDDAAWGAWLDGLERHEMLSHNSELFFGPAEIDPDAFGEREAFDVIKRIGWC